jgi:hypothetical protein
LGCQQGSFLPTGVRGGGEPVLFIHFVPVGGGNVFDQVVARGAVLQLFDVVQVDHQAGGEIQFDLLFVVAQCRAAPLAGAGGGLDCACVLSVSVVICVPPWCFEVKEKDSASGAPVPGGRGTRSGSRV